MTQRQADRFESSYLVEMRFTLPASLAMSFFVCGVGCGGAVAADPGDATTDGNPTTDAIATDTAVSDAGDSRLDAGPSDAIFIDATPDAPTSCAPLSDPCFAQFAAEVQTAAACMGHADTCVASGGTDPSGCGHRTTSPGGGETCNWPDGAHTDASSTSGGSGTGNAFNAKGEICYKYSLTFTAGALVVRVVFPDGRTFLENATTTKPASQSVTCPDGSTSRAFTADDAKACKLGVTCCTAATPPKC